MTKERGKSLNGYPRQSVAAAVPAAIAGDTPATTKAKRAPRFPAKPHAAGECLILPVLRTRRRRIRECVVTRRDRHDWPFFVDCLNAVLRLSWFAFPEGVDS